MADNVVLFPAHANMTVSDCLGLATRESSADEWQDVVVLAYDKDGGVVVRSSHMSRKDALWLLMEAVDHARGKD